MKGIYLTYMSTPEGDRKLIPRLEEHVILPELKSTDVLVQIKACALNRMDIQTLLKLNGDIDQFPVGYEISGVVTKVGDSVTLCVINDQVCGVLPLNTECPGCAEYCVVPEYCLVNKPADVTHIDAVSILSPSIKSYTALFYQAKINSDMILLLFSAASPDGLTVINLCELLEVKVIAIVNSADEAERLAYRHPSIYKIINLVQAKDLIDICMQETGGLGVNCIIDNGVAPGYSISDFANASKEVLDKLERSLNRYEYETVSYAYQQYSLPTKQQIINLLAAQGNWITTQPDIQLDPPETETLRLKGCSLHFLFDPVWVLSGAQQGRYLHILEDALTKLKENKLKCHIQCVIAMGQVCDELVKLPLQQGRVIMTTDISQLG